MEKSISALVPRGKCSGCGVCQTSCNHGAIVFEDDSLGFRYPSVDEKLCIDCGLCALVCPAIKPVANEPMGDCYLAWAKDDSIHYECASGGISTVLAEKCLENGGFVVGCVWDDDFNAIMTIADNKTELKRMQGSKYVMSFAPEETWKQVKNRLKAGQEGIFIGLPCQVAAAKSYTHNNAKLILCDLLCHGGCSPKCLKEHINQIERGAITDIRFRGGKYDCRLTLWNETELKYNGGQYTDPYFYSFMKHGLFRESCYQCQYAKRERVSDITIADYWGIDKEFVKDKKTLNGTNLVILHSEKGLKVWKMISEYVESYQRPIEEAIEGNDTLKEPTNCPPDRDDIIKLIHKVGFKKAINYDEQYKKNISALRKSYVINILKKIMPQPVFEVLRIIKKSI